MQRTKRHRNKLLITLVLLTLALAGAWVTSPADARGLASPGVSNNAGATKPGATIASGDPDAGQGVVPPPPEVKLKRVRPLPGRETAGGPVFDWVLWTSRVWATLYLRAAN